MSEPAGGFCDVGVGELGDRFRFGFRAKRCGDRVGNRCQSAFHIVGRDRRHLRAPIEPAFDGDHEKGN